MAFTWADLVKQNARCTLPLSSQKPSSCQSEYMTWAVGLFVNNGISRHVSVGSPNYQCQLQLAETTHFIDQSPATVCTHTSFLLLRGHPTRITAAWIKHSHVTGVKYSFANVTLPIRNLYCIVNKDFKPHTHIVYHLHVC